MEATFTNEGRKLTWAFIQLADKVPAHRRDEFISSIDNYMKGYNDGMEAGIEKANSLTTLANMAASIDVDIKESQDAKGSTN